MKTSTDYNATVSQLGMGDRFQLVQYGKVHQVAWVDASADGSSVYVRATDGGTQVLATYRRCHVTEAAPRCSCNRRFENCEQGCEWPDELEQLFAL